MQREGPVQYVICHLCQLLQCSTKASKTKSARLLRRLRLKWFKLVTVHVLGRGKEREDEERGLSFHMHPSYLAGKAVHLAFMHCSAAFE